MNDLNLTIIGWVATEPRLVLSRDIHGKDMCSFRVAQSARYFDRNAGQWKNGKTEWFSVRVFKDAAHLVLRSVHKGQPVIVHGRMRTDEWTGADDRLRWDLQVDATCVGHDLTRGVADFSRATMSDDESGDAPLDTDPADLAGGVPDATDAEIAAALAAQDYETGGAVGDEGADDEELVPAR
ncbi:single-stranded DNA-binding protein [Demequina sp.]|uniref:single-stranded DNA-binding protein n=1 Tax=Demequina sp. TaxID=2050685 RepID=UPI003A8C5ADE